MLTRAMAQELEAKVQALERLLDDQKLQIERLLNRATGSNPVPQPATNHFDITRIPDVIKLIPAYDGDTKGLPAWISSVEQKLECAKAQVPDTEKDNALQIWASIIRDKISGKANEILTNNQTECKWADIKAQLINRFGDKRDLSAIINKIPYVKQGNKSVQEFYDECAEILADLNAKIILDPTLQPCAKAVMNSYEVMLTNAFVDGLHDPISSLTRTSRPSTLLSAFQHALDQSNAAERRKEKFKIEPKYNPQALKVTKPTGGWNQNNRYPSNQPRGYNQAYQTSQTNNNPNFKPLMAQPAARPSPPYNNPSFNRTFSNYQHNNYPSNRNFTDQQNYNQTQRPPLAIKQEIPSTSNFKRHQNNVHEEQLNYNNDDWNYEESQNSNAYYPDQSTQENYADSDDLNFQSTPDGNSET